MKKQTTSLILAVVSLLLSGFTLQPPAPKADDLSISIHYTTTVKSDGSGDVEEEFTLSKDFVAQLESQATVSSDDICTSSSPKFHLVDQGQGGEIRCVGSAAFKDLDELNDITENDLNASVDRLEMKDKHFYYDVSMSTGFTGSTGDLKMEILWILVLPGTPGDNNADTVSGRTLTWDLTKSSGLIHLTAECPIGGGGFLGMDTTTTIIVAAVMTSCCCVLLLVAAVVVFLMMRRKNKQSAEEVTP
jgi:hypothetical protein